MTEKNILYNMNMSNLDFDTIGSRIRKRRISMGITQEFIACHLGMSPSCISNIERGHSHPSLRTLIQIANVLECSVDYFICGEYTFHFCTVAAKEGDLRRRITDILFESDFDKRERILKMIELI